MRKILLLPFLLCSLASAAQTTSNKSTDPYNGEWFCYAEASTLQGTSTSKLCSITNDSNLRVYSNNPYNWNVHGIGSSFDPVSQRFSQQWQNGNVAPPTFVVTNGNSYTLDSIEIRGYYRRYNNAAIDTLNIYVAYFPAANGVVKLLRQYPYQVAGRTDSLLGFVSPIYDWDLNRIDPDTATTAVKITKLLDDTVFADSTTDGYHVWRMPVIRNVPAGGKLVAFLTFNSQVQYPLNADIDTANTWRHLTYAINGLGNPPTQLYDYNCGLAAFTGERYHIGNYSTDNNNNAILAPTYADAPEYMADPWFAFHIKCPTCDGGSWNPHVKENSKLITAVNAYPSPANEQLNISFTLVQPKRTTINLLNIYGQLVTKGDLVAKTGQNKTTIPTSHLPAGLYFYTIEAEGQQVNGRFVVQH